MLFTEMSTSMTVGLTVGKSKETVIDQASGPTSASFVNQREESEVGSMRLCCSGSFEERGAAVRSSPLRYQRFLL